MGMTSYPGSLACGDVGSRRGGSAESRPVDGSERHPIGPMRWWDIEAVAALEHDLFAEDSPWEPAMFWSELAAGNYYRVWRDGDGRVLGYAGLAVGVDSADVQTIGVASEARRRGIGRALLRDLLTQAGSRSVFLEVRSDNDAAIAMYCSEGFRRIGTRRRYYQPSGADAHTMLRPAGERS